MQLYQKETPTQVFPVKFKRFLITLCLTEHLQCLLMKVAGFQPTTLLKKKDFVKDVFERILQTL